MKRERISKRLEAIIARTTLNLNSDGISTSYLDRLIVELLGDDATFAYQLMEHLIGDRGVSVVVRRLMQGIIHSPVAERMRPENYYHTVCGEIHSAVEAKRISTAHILYYAATKSNTTFAYEMRGYGITAGDILDAMESLAEPQLSDRATTQSAPTDGEGIIVLVNSRCSRVS